MKVYQKSITIRDNDREGLDEIIEVDGDLRVYSDAKLEAPKLESVDGDLCVCSKLSQKLEKRLWEFNKNNSWVVSESCSDWLLEREGSITYTLSSVQFPKELFDKIRKGEHTAMEVFAIANTEQRRVAYERMDKRKMCELPDFKVVDEIDDDGHGYRMKIVSFTVRGYTKPFLFLNCFCPSTGREYFIETQQIACVKAKARSFGLDSLDFTEEW